MLDYRSRMLPAARNTALLHGYAGAQFPWQSMSHGYEVTPTWVDGLSEQHINLDVAFAFTQYVHATGDEQFLRQQAWPVLEGVAEWIASRVVKTDRGYEICHIEGIDEGTLNVNNNSYINMVSTVILREAQGFARRLGIQPPPEWGEIERKLFIPIDEQAKVILKNDRHRLKDTAVGMETVSAFFPLTYRPADEEVERATIWCCLESVRPFMHYPFIPALVGVFAARLGDRKFSAELFTAGMADFVVDPFMMFCEFGGPEVHDRAPVGTPFLTAPGSFLMACLYGLPGLQLGPGEPESWFKYPVAMPELWEGVEVDQIWVRGRPARLTARHGDKRASIEV
jgi:hypothetical protein